MKDLHPEAYGRITERMDAAQRPQPEPGGFLDVPAENVEDLQGEETLMDVQDYANRIQARKVKPSIPEKQKSKEAFLRKKGAYMSPSANKEIAMYQSVAEEVLKDRKVPPRTKSKEVEGFFTRAMGILGL